jgi:hypothetical protein
VKHWIALSTFAGGLALWAFGACGGMVASDYLDDAGVYHLGGDGGVFAPGSACVGWDASHVADPSPACNPADAGGPVCQQWEAEWSPPGFPFNESECLSNTDGGGECFKEGTGTTPSCDKFGLSAAGNEFCTAWLQQFLVKGTALSICYQFESTFRCSIGSNAQQMEVCGEETGLVATVGSDGGVVCSPPCAP